MSFMTYILLFGFVKGFGQATFTPDVVIQAIWRCLLLQLVESGLIKFGLNLMSVSSIPFIEIFAYTGYKYVGLCIATVARLFGRVISTLVTLALAGLLAFFFLKSLAAAVPASTTTGPPRHLVLLGFAGLQFVVLLLLSWY